MTIPVSVAVYTPLNRLAIPSGVPRHITEIVPRLMRCKKLKVSLFVNRTQVSQYLQDQDPIWLESGRVMFDRPVGQMQRLWGLAGYPSFEKMGGSADWLYLPADGYVPTLSAKLAVTVHDIYRLDRAAATDQVWRHRYEGLRIWPVYGRIAASADHLITVSRFSADRIMSILNVPAKRITIAYNGVDGCFFSPDDFIWPLVKAKVGAVGDQFFVVLGGLKSKKNARGIIAAWQRFEATRRDYELVVTGHHDPEYMARASKLLNRVRFAPRLTDAELAVLLNRSRGLLFPSFYEGFGLPALEALAAGATVIASDIPVFQELLGSIPIYVDPGDVTSIVSGLMEASRPSIDNGDRVSAGRALAREFTWQRSAAAVSSVFK